VKELAEKPRLGILENAPPWWPNFKPPDFTEEDLREMERYCTKIVENLKEEEMTPWERWKVTMQLGIPDRPVVFNMPLMLAVSRALDCWSDSLKPGIDMYHYPKLALKAHFIWNARFNIDTLYPYPYTYGDTEWGYQSRAKLLPYAAPAWVDPPLRTPDDFDKIHLPDMKRDGFYPAYFWTLRKAKEFMKKYGIPMPLHAAFCGDPYSTPSILRGLKQYVMDIKRNPDLMKKCVEIATKHVVNYGKACLEAGADVMGCCAWSGIAGLEAYKPYDKYQIEAVKAIGADKFVWMYGFDQSPTLEYQCQTGSMPIGWYCTHETPIELSRRVATKYKKIFANFFDPLIVVHGPPEAIIDTVRKNINVGAGPGFIFLHSAVDYWCPLEYVELVVKTAKEYGKEVYKGLR